MYAWVRVCWEVNPNLVVRGLQGVHLILAVRGHRRDQGRLSDLKDLVPL